MDALLLHALSDKAKHNSLRHAVPQGMLAPDTSALLQWYAAYFATFPERERVDVDELQSLIRLRSCAASPEAIAITMHLTEQLRNRPDDVALNGILGQLVELDLSGRSAALIERYNQGEELDLAYELNRLAALAVRQKAASTGEDYIRTRISDLLAEVANDHGLKFRRWVALRDHILGLTPGASVAVAARPDKGKTSLIAAILTDFAPQLHALFPPERQHILWMNNEGPGKRIIPRVYQAALGKDLNEIIAMSNAGTLDAAYAAAVGRWDTIRVKDMHGASMAQVEQIIEQQQPAIVVADMLANFRLGGPQNGANKADGVEQLWQEWREIMVRHNCIGLATVQISAEGGNMLYPPYSAMKDSKTGIQGATDVILMMGALDAAEAQTLRGISTVKNKFAAPGKASIVQAELYFDGSKCVFNDGAGATPS